MMGQNFFGTSLHLVSIFFGTSLYLEWWVKTPTVSIFFGTSLYLEWWVKTPTISHKHFFLNITVPWMMGQNSNHKHFFLEHHSTLNDGSVSQKKKKKKKRMIGQNSNHKHYLISGWVIWDSGANWTQKWTVVINAIKLLTIIFKILVKNLVKENFYKKNNNN